MASIFADWNYFWKRYNQWMAMNKPEVGKYRTIPKGTIVWSIDHQTNITFEKDEIVKITNTVYGSNHFFGELSQCLFEHCPGFIPTMIGKGSSKGIALDFDKTEPYDVPKPWFGPFWSFSG